MRIKSTLKLGFFQPLTWLTLGILAGTGMPPLLLAQTAIAHASAPSLSSLEMGTKLGQCTERQPDLRSDSPQRGSHCEELEGQQQRQQEERAQKQEIAQRQQEDRSRLEAQSLYDQGKYASAETIFRKLVEASPDDVALHYQLGNVLYRQDKLEEAATQFQKVLKLNSKYAIAHNAIGVIRARLGNWDQAVAEFKQALSINPDYAEALQNLGRALWQQGNGKEAIAPLEKAKTLFKQQLRFEDVRQVDQLLQEINKKKVDA